MKFALFFAPLLAHGANLEVVVHDRLVKQKAHDTRDTVIEHNDTRIRGRELGSRGIRNGFHSVRIAKPNGHLNASVEHVLHLVHLAMKRTRVHGVGLGLLVEDAKHHVVNRHVGVADLVQLMNAFRKGHLNGLQQRGLVLDVVLARFLAVAVAANANNGIVMDLDSIVQRETHHAESVIDANETQIVTRELVRLGHGQRGKRSLQFDSDNPRVVVLGFHFKNTSVKCTTVHVELLVFTARRVHDIVQRQVCTVGAIQIMKTVSKSIHGITALVTKLARDTHRGSRLRVLDAVFRQHFHGRCTRKWMFNNSVAKHAHRVGLVLCTTGGVFLLCAAQLHFWYPFTLFCKKCYNQKFYHGFRN